MLEVGMKAPNFTLPDKNGNMVSLSDFLGKKVVLPRGIRTKFDLFSCHGAYSVA